MTVTGRVLLETALRAPMAERGWRPRAKGWFTRDLGAGALAVVAASTHGEGMAAGTRMGTAYVGVRLDAVQPVVATLTDVKDDGYRFRMATSNIGYVLPERRWRDWYVDAAAADRAAAEIAALTETHVVPYLLRLRDDTDLLIEGVRHSAAMTTSIGFVTIAVLLAHAGRRDEAYRMAHDAFAETGDEQAAWAVERRTAAARLVEWLDAAE